MRMLSALILTLMATFCLGATTKLDFDSSVFIAGPISVGGNFASNETNNLTLELLVDGVVVTTVAATDPITGGIPAVAQKWSIYLGGSYTSGPHILTIRATANRVWTAGVATTTVVVATATQSIIVDNSSARAYLSQVDYKTPDNTYYASYVRDDFETLFVKGQTAGVYLANNSQQFIPNSTRFFAMYVSIDDVQNGNSERIDLAATDINGTSTAGAGWLPTTLASVGSYSNANRTYTVLSNPANATPGAFPYEFQAVFRALVYKNSAINPTLGTRPIAVSFLTAAGSVTAPTFVMMTVKNGIPLFSLTGIFGTDNQSNDYLQGTGAFVFAPNADVDSQNPSWRPLYQSSATGPPSQPYYTPAYFYQMDGTTSITEVKTGVIDTLTVSLFNPNANLLSSEDISFTLPTAYSYNGSDAGNILAYDGTFTSTPFNYPMYVPVVTKIVDSANRKTWTVTLGQTTQTLQVAPSNRSKLPLTENMVRQIVRSLSYSNASNNPGSNGVTRRVEFQVTNSSTSPSGLRTSAVVTQTITLVPTNSPPTVAFSGALVVDENNSNVATAVPVSGFTIADPDGNNFGATGALINNPEFVRVKAANGTLTYSGSLADVVVVSGNGTNSLLLKGPVDGTSGTLTEVFSGNRISYTPDIGFSGADSIEVTLSDSGNSSVNQSVNSPLSLTASATAVVTVTKVNQPATITAPLTRQTTSGQSFVLTSITAIDPDVLLTSPTILQMSAQATNGVLSLDGTIGLSFAFSDAEGAGTGSGTANPNMVFRGNSADIFNALRELSYRSNANFYGIDTITLRMNDLGSSGVRRNAYLSATVTPGAGAASLISRAAISMNVLYVNSPPAVATNVAKTVPIGANVVLAGGTYVPATSFYPPATTRLATSFNAPIPSNAGTTATGTSNLVAQDVETKQASGLTYTINLPVTQGSLQLSRPSVAVVDLVAGSTFTQNDLNNGYVTYTHNGSLSGDDGFVFTVTDDNATTAPSNAPGGQINGATSQQIFNLTIDRTKPIAIFNGSVVPTFTEPIAPAAAVPVLLDNDPLTRVVNATDTTNFVTVGNTGRLTATVSIPTQVGVNPGTVSSDPLDTLTIRDQPPIGFTGSQLFYNGSPIGSYAGGQGTPLVVTLSSALPISVSAVSELLRHIEYSNPGANPSASQRVVTVTVLNGAGQQSVDATTLVDVMPYNDAPVITPPARPLVLVPGLTLGSTVQATDPDGVLSFALSGSPPTRGLVTVNATTGAYTYTPAPNAFGLGGALTDQFEITASDPGILTDLVSKTATQVYQVRISDLGAAAPVFTSNPPLETVLGRVLTYAPQVSVTGVPGGGTLVYSLVDAPAINPGLGFDPATGTITWPANWTATPTPTADSYQKFGLLVVDQATDVAAYQPILLKVLLTPSGSN